MNARGTRRPHPRRVRSKPMRRVGKGGGSKSCLVLVLAFLAISAVVVYTAVDVVWAGVR